MDNRLETVAQLFAKLPQHSCFGLANRCGAKTQLFTHDVIGLTFHYGQPKSLPGAGLEVGSDLFQRPVDQALQSVLVRGLVIQLAIGELVQGQ